MVDLSESMMPSMAILETGRGLVVTSDWPPACLAWALAFMWMCMRKAGLNLVEAGKSLAARSSGMPSMNCRIMRPQRTSVLLMRASGARKCWQNCL